MLTRRKILTVVALLFIVCLTVPVARADSHYWIPTYGFNWPSLTIYVNVPPHPICCYADVVEAINTWNEAQSWFKQKYFPNGDTYQLVIGNEQPYVLVDFTDISTVRSVCPSLPSNVGGCTNVRWDTTNTVTSAKVYLDTKQTDEFLVLHEFGHVLGLPDYPNDYTSCPFPDLMCYQVGQVYPSTLDLYAIHLLAGGLPITTVHLPSSIPYFYFSPAFATTTPTSTDFSLSVSPSTLLLNSNESISFNLMVTVSGSGGTIQMTVPNLPSYFKLVNLPNSTGGSTGSGETFTVTLDAGSQTPDGNYNLTITGISGKFTHSVMLTVIVSSITSTTIQSTSIQSTSIPSSTALTVATSSQLTTSSEAILGGVLALVVALILASIVIVQRRRRRLIGKGLTMARSAATKICKS